MVATTTAKQIPHYNGLETVGGSNNVPIHESNTGGIRTSCNKDCPRSWWMKSYPKPTEEDLPKWSKGREGTYSVYASKLLWTAEKGEG